LTAWNHNIHYRPLLLRAVPEGCERALDVGCGEGTLARELRGRVARVTAIDADPASIALARGLGGDIEYVLGDLMTHPFAPGSFEFVVCVAALHHMDADAALARMRVLLVPGGVLAILGLARSRFPADLPRGVAATVVSRWHRLTADHWESPAPIVWPPPQTYPEVRAVVERELPGALVQRHLLWRYSVIWAKP
jgi:SAM-dependent methyltransferase